MAKKVLLLIPARFQSSRFPGKPLVSVAGVSMIKRVLDNMSNIVDPHIIFDAYVVTDDIRIEKHILEFSTKVFRVDDDVISGTQRIELAYNRFFAKENWDLVINVQGDEPLLQREEIIRLAKFHFITDFDIATMVKRNLSFDTSFFDPNKVKVVLSEKDGQAFYFSRSPIPYKRDLYVGEQYNNFWYQHIGVYSYRPKILSRFAKLPESRLENLEKLEQLRAIENGITIGAITTDCILVGIDSPEDVVIVEKMLSEMNSR